MNATAFAIVPQSRIERKSRSNDMPKDDESKTHSPAEPTIPEPRKDLCFAQNAPVLVAQPCCGIIRHATANSLFTNDKPSRTAG